MATRYNEEEGGGGDIFYEWLMALYIFLIQNNFIGGSYEKIIRFYFLYEILKEFIFYYKKIS